MTLPLARAALFAATLATTAAASAHVEVSYQDAQRFTEFTYGLQRADDKRSQAWLADLQRYVQTQAARFVPDGQTLVVTISDVRRAGRIEPGRFAAAPDLRVVRDIDSPRIDLSFTLKAADGTVLKQGDRKLRDLAFLQGIPRHANDTLRFEKSLIDDWLAEEFAPAAAG